jgi:hypothetical protein
MAKVKSKILLEQSMMKKSSTREEQILEQFSYGKLIAAEHVDGNFVVDPPKKEKRGKCPLGRKIVSSPFFRSIVYDIDSFLRTAEDILHIRKQDLHELNHYIKDEQIEEDDEYKQELAREVIFWTRMVELYKTIKQNRSRWYKQGKFPWSGTKVSTPYYGAPPFSMNPQQQSKTTPDTEMTPVDASKRTSFVQELQPVSRVSNRKKRSRV